jgi:hypothetical protein
MWYDAGGQFYFWDKGSVPIPPRFAWGVFSDTWVQRIGGGRQAMPLRMIWPGFVIDTLFYAAISGGVFFGFTSAKRFIRIKRGRCPRCGYDLRGGVMSDERLAISGHTATSTAGCPECGWGRNTD